MPIKPPFTVRQGPALEHASDVASVGDEAAVDCAAIIERPDLSVMRQNRRPPPQLPLRVFGDAWKHWIEEAAAGAACPVDFVVPALLSTASAVIGNARWAEATPGWCEPPHLWCAAVGDSGQGKSPGADAIFRHVVPSIEASMAGDFARSLEDHHAKAESREELDDDWEEEEELIAKRSGPSQPTAVQMSEKPIAPRFMESDLTIEKVAMVLSSAAPKGLLMARDELAGWLLGMNAYNQSARAFWLEAHGGRPYRVDRIKHPEPIVVPHLAVAWHGGIQPSRLARVMQEADDGLLARFCWFWPDPVPFKLTTTAPNIEFAVAAFDRLGMLAMAPTKEHGLRPTPTKIPLCESGRVHLEKFARDMQIAQSESGGLLVSTLGKARGLALRLSLVLEFLWWAGQDGIAAAPEQISEAALLSAVTLVSEYLMPMAERVYGDAVASPRTKNVATLARWIVKTRPAEVYVRRLQREVRLPGLGEAATVHEACKVLVEAGWLKPATAGTREGRGRAAYPVCAGLWEALESVGASGRGPMS